MHLTRTLIRPSAGLLRSNFQNAQNYRSSILHIERRQFSKSKQLAEAIVIPSPCKKSFIRRALTVVALGTVFTTLGFLMASLPAMDVASKLLNPPTNEETLSMYMPGDTFEQSVEDHINTHPLVLSLRQNPDFSESRPHMKIPASQRPHNLTGGTLLGPGRVVVPPFAWNEKGGKSMVSISYLGPDLCGHPGIVHGGFLATILDEGLARCCFGALPNKIGMTANLNINYRSPALACKYIVLRATTTKVEGRKAWVEGRLETLVGEGETPVLIADASALFIEPRQAATMARVYPA
ncbi:HotDog domain-containing protein [Calycina marina]|uniref:HotDog domain-containing protein n=1 Tax=Calycina marina TaxID=1763456 RepID=A0A9P7Z5C1_9HELO|nr:HotDog domain-containing protein [Calycina marina]